MSPKKNNAGETSLDFEDFFRATPGYLSVHDPDFRIIAVNDNYIPVFGDNVGRFCYEVHKQRDSVCPDCPVEKTFIDGKSHIREYNVTLSDGRQIPLIAMSSPIFDSSTGKVKAVTQISADITLVKQLQGQLQESHERFHLLFDEVPCYISVQDRKLRIVESNRKFKEDFGDLEGTYCYEVYKHRKEQCLHCPVAATFHDGKSHYSEEVVTSLSGEQINTLVYTAPIKNAKGEIELVMEMSTNITQIRTLQGRLTNLGMFVGSLSHGLKGLLMSLDGGIYMLKTGIEKNMPERLEAGWQIVQRNAENIRRVVLDLLNLAGESTPHFEPYPLIDLARSVVKRMEKKTKDLDIDFQVEIACKDETCELDVNSIKGCLINILENALEACRIDRKKKSHFIRFSLTSDNDNVIFQIEDNGIGMDRETQERMFSLSFSSVGKEGGNLRLFTANKVVEKHRGVIEIQSDPNDGTRFDIRIPKVRGKL